MDRLKLLLVSLILMVSAVSQEKAIFNEAKVLIFDGKWSQALEKLEMIESRFSDSSIYPSAIFYKGKCLAETGKYIDSIQTNQLFLNISENAALKEEAEVSIINCAHSLYKSGQKEYISQIVKRLDNSSKTIKYYAAFTLSYISDRDISKRSLPILNNIIKSETDQELKDRAKLAILRVDPQALNTSEQQRNYSSKTLKIRVLDKQTQEKKITVNIPFALAELALKSLPDSEKQKLKNEGYDLDTMIKLIVETGEIIRIEDENEMIKIWIE